MKTKTYAVTEKGITTIVEATSQVSALAKHFGCERPVKCMSYASQQTWGNRRYSKNTREGYRSATICETNAAAPTATDKDSTM